MVFIAQKIVLWRLIVIVAIRAQRGSGKCSIEPAIWPLLRGLDIEFANSTSVYSRTLCFNAMVRAKDHQLAMLEDQRINVRAGPQSEEMRSSPRIHPSTPAVNTFLKTFLSCLVGDLVDFVN